MNLLFFGSSSFSVPALVSLHSSISCVVTKKTKPKGRGYLLEDNEVKRAALSLGLPVREIGSFKDEEAAGLGELKPDLLVVVSFGLIIPRWFLDLPTLGAINVHPSLLPKYRGPSPMQWAIRNGEEETGITVIRMNERMDAGDILYQENVRSRAGRGCGEPFKSACIEGFRDPSANSRGSKGSKGSGTVRPRTTGRQAIRQ